MKLLLVITIIGETTTGNTKLLVKLLLVKLLRVINYYL